MSETSNSPVAPKSTKTPDTNRTDSDGKTIEIDLTNLSGSMKRLAKFGQSLSDSVMKTASEAVDTLCESVEETRKAYDGSRESASKEKEEADSYSIPPWYIASGIGSLDRRALCEFLAVFEETSLTNVSVDGIRDLVERLKKGKQEGVKGHFEERIRSVSDEYCDDQRRSDAWLRFRLWNRITTAFDLEPSIPLSTGFAGYRCSQVADRARNYFEAPSLSDGPSENLAAKLGRKAAEVQRSVEDRFSGHRRTFTQMVRLEAARHIVRALDDDNLPAEARRAIEDSFRKKLDELPAEFHGRSLDQAVEAGDWATVVALGTGGSLVGVGIAVEIAGFSAYIAAAQASAIIPFLGGQTAVSLLAVAANPIFILLALSAGGYAINHSFKKKIASKVATGLAVQLALQGLAGSVNGLKVFLDDLKNLTDEDLADERLVKLRGAVKQELGSLPETPGVPKTKLPDLCAMSVESDLNRILFPSDRSSLPDAVAVAGLTTAEIIFDAAAIDPRVVSAADFSRAEDIEGIFSFGWHAKEIEAMTDIARAGAENQLRGYVAEMVVATRLAEHDVSFAENPNTAGYDLRVDGNPFQVKCYRDGDAARSALDEHFANNPDIPVFLNSEALDAVQASGRPWAEKVFGVEGFDYEQVNSVMEQSLEAGADLMNVHVPLFAIAVSAARNVQGWWKGTIPLRDIPLEVVLDGTLHGTLSIAGGYTAGGVGMLLFGPAGGVIFGGVGHAVGVLGHGPLRRQVDNLVAREWAESLGDCCDALSESLEEAMCEKIRRIRSKALQVKIAEPEMDAWIRRKFDDRAVCIAECKSELADLPDQTVERARSLLRIMRESGVHAWSVREQFKEMETTLGGRPSVTDLAKSGYDKHLRKWMPIRIEVAENDRDPASKSD